MIPIVLNAFSSLSSGYLLPLASFVYALDNTAHGGKLIDSTSHEWKSSRLLQTCNYCDLAIILKLAASCKRIGTAPDLHLSRLRQQTRREAETDLSYLSAC